MPAGEAIKSFAGALQKQLKSAMADGGPTAAIEVCNVAAPQIAQTASTVRGWSVGRTSLKLRNPDNAPDEWELGVLRDFDTRKAAGEDPGTLDHAEFVAGDGQRTFRYMKAIGTQPVCTVCHGTSIAPEVTARLDAPVPGRSGTRIRSRRYPGRLLDHSAGALAVAPTAMHTVACVAARCGSLRASRLPNSSRESSPISPRARPAASITPAHPRSIRRKPNPRPPQYRPCPDCARPPVRHSLASPRLLRSPPHTVRLTRVHDRRLKIAPPRPRFVCYRTDIEPHNDRTNTHATMAIDALFCLSLMCSNPGVDFGDNASFEGLEARIDEVLDMSAATPGSNFLSVLT